MHSDFAAQKPECIVAFTAMLRTSTQLLRPVGNRRESSQTPAARHRRYMAATYRPSPGFGTTCSRVNGHNRIERIVFARRAASPSPAFNRPNTREHRAHGVNSASTSSPSLANSKYAAMSSPRRASRRPWRACAPTLLLAHHLLRTLRIRPQIRIGGLPLDFS